MAGVNKVILLGRLGKDPETKTIGSGQMVANFSIATSETWKDKSTGEKKESTEWHNCQAWGPVAEIIQKYVHKGDQVYVEGKLKTRSWEKDGITRYVTEIIVSGVNLIGGGKQEQTQQTYSAPVQQQKNEPDPLAKVTQEDIDQLPF